MSTPNKTDRFIESFLADGIDQLPDHVYDEVRHQIDHTRQRVVFGPWREEQMSRFAWIALAAAAVVLIAVIGIRFLPATDGLGGRPTPTPSPTAAGAPLADKDGRLEPGMYVAHPFATGSISFTFSVPSGNWEGIAFDAGHVSAIIWNGDSGGVGVGFLRVNSLNGDACNWFGSADDVEVGPSAADLADALTASTEFAASVPTDVAVSGYSGKHVLITMPDTGFSGSTAIDCDRAQYTIWNAEGFDIFAQGASHKWDLTILDVEGERIVIMETFFDDSEAVRTTELHQIADSIQIEP